MSGWNPLIFLAPAIVLGYITSVTVLGFSSLLINLLDGKNKAKSKLLLKTAVGTCGRRGHETINSANVCWAPTMCKSLSWELAKDKRCKHGVSALGGFSVCGKCRRGATAKLNRNMSSKCMPDIIAVKLKGWDPDWLLPWTWRASECGKVST